MTSTISPIAPDLDPGFVTMLGRLSRLSVGKGVDAYADIDWDAPELSIDPWDLRHRLDEVDPVAATDWYRGLSPQRQAYVGMARISSCLKVGWHFENLLQQALLHRALYLPDGSPEFRYSLHEVIEETQHTLMFNELINRAGIPVRGMPRWLRRLAEWRVPLIASRLPELFFVMVLGGEDPIDHLQRKLLAVGGGHPLVEQIMRIHIAEEARHLSYARSALKQLAPRLSPWRRQLLAISAPLVLGVMVRLMLVPGRDVARTAEIPSGVVRQAFRTPAGRQLLRDAAARPRELLGELGLITPLGRLVWSAVGLWDN